MKLGSFDLGLATLIYIVPLVLLVLVDVAMWRSRKDLLTESWYRGAIVRGLVDEGGDAGERGIEACQALIRKQPGHIDARLYLASMYFKQARYGEAQAAWDEVVNNGNASGEEKAAALVGMGVARFTAAPKDGRAAAALEAEKFFRRALEYRPTADAHANLALVQAWKGGDGNLSEAESHITEALGTRLPPALKVAEQLYYLQGLILSHKKPAEAGAAFDRAAVVRPGWHELEDARRWALLAVMGQGQGDEKARRTTLEKVAAQVNTYGAEKASVLNALAMAWYQFKNSPDYLAGPLPNAVRLFKQAISECPTDGRAYRSLGAMDEDRIAEIGKTLTGQVTGINGETPEKAGLQEGKEADKHRFLPEDLPKIKELRNLLRDEEVLWQAYVDKAARTPDEKIDGKLRQLSCQRRQIWLLEATELAQRQTMWQRALELANQIVALNENNGQAHFTKGLVILEKGDRSGALAEFKAAQAKGWQSPELDRLLGGFGANVEITDVFPTSACRQFGSKPLVRATLKTGGTALKSAAMKIDGKDVKAKLLGSQLCYMPAPGELNGEAHTVTVSLTDAAGGSASTQFMFYVDTKPPVWSVAPDLGAPLPGTSVFSITVSDGAEGSGVDYSTLNVSLQSTAGAAADLGVIKDGHYKFALPKINVKEGEAVVSSPFKLAPKADLPPGQYRLMLDVKDRAGNALSDMKVFTVK